MDDFELYGVPMILEDRLRLSGHKLIALTGGGGKTSLLYALGEFFAAGKRVVITTTTKIFATPLDKCAKRLIGPLEDCMGNIGEQPAQALIVMAKEISGEKFLGHAPDEICELASSGAADMVITESDGSRGFSLKGYEDWEPPVPQNVSCQIIVIGADAFTVPMSVSTVFRFDLLSKKYGIQPGEYLSVANCAAMLSNRTGYLKNSPDNAYRILFINKAELFSEEQLVGYPNELAAQLKDYDAIVTASMQLNTVYDIKELNRS